MRALHRCTWQEKKQQHKQTHHRRSRCNNTKCRSTQDKASQQVKRRVHSARSFVRHCHHRESADKIHVTRLPTQCDHICML